jgi:hypothetical protein
MPDSGEIRRRKRELADETLKAEGAIPGRPGSV